MSSIKRKILVIENQQSQFEKIIGYLDPFDVYPREDKYVEFIDYIRVWVNRQYKKEGFRNDALALVNSIINDNGIELILMDHILGGAYHCLTGIDLAKEINSIKKEKSNIIPIVFLSKTEHNDKNRLNSYDLYNSEFPNTSTWIHKGYFGNEILNKEYFKEHVITKFEKLLGETHSQKIEKYINHFSEKIQKQESSEWKDETTKLQELITLLRSLRSMNNSIYVELENIKSTIDNLEKAEVYEKMCDSLIQKLKLL